MPLLMLGAGFGALFAVAAGMMAPALTPDAWAPAPFAVAGMAGLFAAVVRAPLTGMALVIEMTGRADLSLSILAVSVAATMTATLVGSEPIYDSLGHRMLADPSFAAQVLQAAA
jgi:CIC family chloride channel protein